MNPGFSKGSPNLLEKDERFCPVRDFFGRVGDKWSLLVTFHLGAEDRLRFNELRRRVDGISQRMLTVTLRSLERDGLVKRDVFPEVPPRVEYSLTKMGREFLVQIKGILSWAHDSVDEITEARALYDERHQN
ncbi:helix-turn-helix domain-containing protein [Pontibacter sp. G13]|uniref:winged helix-turn-helix transcriptional regulator n=1 Tax=Pontibacter sp. G13 TaxID=3074898 RepID=UPI00288BE090|nr:helix-turn-helix domain-containing protein [Pontibacter sp. G13]WNJ18942.1 helix-turn-helix domain-containing protein [Pontibacter sp. G13]